MTLSTSLEQQQDRRNKWLFETMSKKHFQRGEGKRYNPKKNPTSQHKTTEPEQGQMNIGWTRRRWPAGYLVGIQCFPARMTETDLGDV